MPLFRSPPYLRDKERLCFIASISFFNLPPIFAKLGRVHEGNTGGDLRGLAPIICGIINGRAEEEKQCLCEVKTLGNCDAMLAEG